MQTRNLPQEGDVLVSKRFINGSHDMVDRKILHVGADSPNDIMNENIPEDERIAMAAKTGKVPPKTRQINLGSSDPSRGTAKYVVISTGWGGASERDGIPDRWQVVAKRLDNNGRFDPKGEEIYFDVGDIAADFKPGEINTVGQMQKIFI